MYTLTGAPVNVHQGDWIAGKACGCATVQHPSLGALDVWDTHVSDARTERGYSPQFTALGGQVGGEERRAFRITEAYELAELCRASAERGRHVLCMGDLNSLPESLSMGILRSVAGLQDTAAVGAADAQITCDSPRNTWTHGKPLDENALRNAGKRLDYVLYRGPASSASRLQCAAHRVVFDGKIPGHDVSFTDHFGVEAEFSLLPQDAAATAPAPRVSGVVSVLDQALGVLREALVAARSQQQRHMSAFVAALGGAVVLIAGNACASAWLWHGRSVAPSVLLALLLIPTSWFGTTALYTAVIWGEWHKRTCSVHKIHTDSAGALRMFLNRIETHRDALESELA